MDVLSKVLLLGGKYVGRLTIKSVNNICSTTKQLKNEVYKKIDENITVTSDYQNMMELFNDNLSAMDCYGVSGINENVTFYKSEKFDYEMLLEETLAKDIMMAKENLIIDNAKSTEQPNIANQMNSTNLLLPLMKISEKPLMRIAELSQSIVENSDSNLPSTTNCKSGNKEEICSSQKDEVKKYADPTNNLNNILATNTKIIGDTKSQRLHPIATENGKVNLKTNHNNKKMRHSVKCDKKSEQQLNSNMQKFEPHKTKRSNSKINEPKPTERESTILIESNFNEDIVIRYKVFKRNLKLITNVLSKNYAYFKLMQNKFSVYYPVDKIDSLQDEVEHVQRSLRTNLKNAREIEYKLNACEHFVKTKLKENNYKADQKLQRIFGKKLKKLEVELAINQAKIIECEMLFDQHKKNVSDAIDNTLYNFETMYSKIDPDAHNFVPCVDKLSTNDYFRLNKRESNYHDDPTYYTDEKITVPQKHKLSNKAIAKESTRSAKAKKTKVQTHAKNAILLQKIHPKELKLKDRSQPCMTATEKIKLMKSKIRIYAVERPILANEEFKERNEIVFAQSDFSFTMPNVTKDNFPDITVSSSIDSSSFNQFSKAEEEHISPLNKMHLHVVTQGNVQDNPIPDHVYNINEHVKTKLNEIQREMSKKPEVVTQKSDTNLVNETNLVAISNLFICQHKCLTKIPTLIVNKPDYNRFSKFLTISQSAIKNSPIYAETNTANVWYDFETLTNSTMKILNCTKVVCVTCEKLDECICDSIKCDNKIYVEDLNSKSDYELIAPKAITCVALTDKQEQDYIMEDFIRLTRQWRVNENIFNLLQSRRGEENKKCSTKFRDTSISKVGLDLNNYYINMFKQLHTIEKPLTITNNQVQKAYNCISMPCIVLEQKLSLQLLKKNLKFKYLDNKKLDYYKVEVTTHYQPEEDKPGFNVSTESIYEDFKTLVKNKESFKNVYISNLQDEETTKYEPIKVEEIKLPFSSNETVSLRNTIKQCFGSNRFLVDIDYTRSACHNVHDILNRFKNYINSKNGKHLSNYKKP